jgi:cytochrome b561/polyisoprenoid-binding protein YceI
VSLASKPEDLARPQAAAPPPLPRTRYGLVAIVLHWLIAAMIVVQIVLAGRMEGPPTPQHFAVTQLHKSIGITVLILTLARIGWRLVNRPPPMPAGLAAWERRLARWTHAGFYLVMLGMPLTGWIMISTSRIAVPTLLYGVVPWPMLPGLPELAGPAKHAWHTVGETGHGLIIKLAYVLIALHVAGALKHQLFGDDEPVLARMAPGAVPGRWREPRILLIALGALAVIAFGRLYQPPTPKLQAPPPGAAVAPEPAEAQAPPAAAAPAPATPAPAPAAAAAEPARWLVAPGSSLAFESAWSGQAVRGRFERWRADIVFSPEALERSRVKVTVDMASADTGDAQRDAALPAPDWFDSAAHPQAVFTATRFRKTGEGSFVAEGTLSLRGVSRPLALPFSLQIDGDRAEARGSAALDRTAFGVGQGEFAAVDQIPARVGVAIDVKARLAK